MKKRLRKKSEYLECSHSKLYKEVHDELPYCPIEYIQKCTIAFDCGKCKGYFVAKKVRTQWNQFMKYQRKHWNDE